MQRRDRQQQGGSKRGSHGKRVIPSVERGTWAGARNACLVPCPPGIARGFVLPSADRQDCLSSTTKPGQCDRQQPEHCCHRPPVERELGGVVEGAVFAVDAGEPVPPRLEGSAARQLVAEDLVEPVARLAEPVEAQERADRYGDRQQRRSDSRPDPCQGVFGATTQSVHTLALSLPLLSMEADRVAVGDAEVDVRVGEGRGGHECIASAEPSRCPDGGAVCPSPRCGRSGSRPGRARRPDPRPGARPSSR